MVFLSPPILKMSCSLSSAWITTPALRKRRALKKAWVTKWKIAGGPCAGPQGKEHVAHLAYGGIGKDPLYVFLREGACAGDKKSHAADQGDDELDIGCEDEERMHPRYQIDPSRYHGGRVDEGAYRSRTGHGVG